MHKIPPPLALTLLSALSLGTTSLWAQATPGAETAPANQLPDDDVVVLSPFVVEAGEDKGYLANATVAGTRVRTDLKDVASSIQVITSQFLRDTQAKDNQTLLQYTTNTEVGGLYGNFAGVGNTFVDGAGEGVGNLLRPNGNTRVRGLDSADNTRDLIKTDIPWGSFNVGRVDFQRGPNSILFGLGSPAGIINASTNTAGFKTEGRIEAQIGSFGSKRFTGDYTYVLIPNELSIRIDAQDDQQQYRQKPAFNRDRRIFGALRWDPQLFSTDGSAHTSIRANFESGTVNANRPRSLPPIDRITPFFDANKINKTLIDPYYDYVRGIFPWTTPGGDLAKNCWLVGNTGYNFGKNPTLYYNNTATPISAAQGSPYNYYSIDHQNNGFPYSSAAAIGTYADWARNLQQYGAANGVPSNVLATVAGAQSGFYKATSITDTSIFDFYNTLIDGTTKKEWQGWSAYNVSIEQSFFHNRLAFQAVYDRQTYHDGSENNLGWQPYISVDIMKNTMQYPWAYTDLVTANPNAGRAYTGGGNGGNGSRNTERENILITGTGVLKATDFLSKSLLTRILGRHTITGVYSSEQYDTEDRSWVRYAATGAWSDLIGTGYNGGDGTGGLRSGDVVLGNVVYLSGSLLNTSSASGLNLPGINNEFSPSGALPVKYYDAHWKWPTNPSASGYVDPTAPWTNPTSYPTPTASTQASNPYNYVGWKDTTVTILNADKGDIDQLYTDASKLRKTTTSWGATWQAYLWDDVLVGTFGVRRDKQKQRGGSAPQDNTGLASMDYDLEAQQPNGISSGTSKSWGIVVHTPSAIRKMLPGDTNFSLSYSNGNNTRVENRYGFNAQALPNAKGNTKDIALAITTLNDRLTVKITRYETNVKDANISTVNSQTATLGSSTSTLMNVEAWGTASAMMCQAGLDGQFPGWDWYWNWANISGGYAKSYDNSVPTDPLFLSNAETIKEKAAIKSWQDQMLPQSWFDSFGFPINVAKVKAGDWGNAISNGAWQPPSYLGSVQAAGAGKVNGSWPTGTVDNRSEGWEFEITGKPIKGLDISFNASKQKAQQIALGKDLVDFVEAEYAKLQSPAGDLRVWWGGDNTFRQMFNKDVWSAYQFQKQTSGKMVAEMAPWRANLTANYDIDRGWFKGGNIGVAYRWQQGAILGYALNETLDNLDINKPYWSKSQDWVDLWVGYSVKLSNKINWRIQVNLRNVGQKPHLTPISVQPDGTTAQYRIEEGLTWQLTNTFSF